jgi:hypothetical protein
MPHAPILVTQLPQAAGRPLFAAIFYSFPRRLSICTLSMTRERLSSMFIMMPPFRGREVAAPDGLRHFLCLCVAKTSSVAPTPQDRPHEIDFAHWHDYERIRGFAGIMRSARIPESSASEKRHGRRSWIRRTWRRQKSRTHQTQAARVRRRSEAILSVAEAERASTLRNYGLVRPSLSYNQRNAHARSRLLGLALEPPRSPLLRRPASALRYSRWLPPIAYARMVPLR